MELFIQISLQENMILDEAAKLTVACTIVAYILMFQPYNIALLYMNSKKIITRNFIEVCNTLEKM